MLLEIKLILAVGHIQPFVDNLEILFEAVATLKPGGKEVWVKITVRAGNLVEKGKRYHCNLTMHTAQPCYNAA